MANWGDIIVVGVILIAGSFIMYKALKEPIDQFGGFIGRIFGNLRERASNASYETQEVIYYG